MKKFIVLICLLAILYFGNNLRSHNYATVPYPGEIADEYSFGWLGVSLLDKGYPIAWSGIGAYENTSYKKINVDHIYDQERDVKAFAIDKPWFDHPPLFGLVTGGYAYLKDVREFADTSVIILRRPMLKIAILNTLLIFWLATILFSSKTGILSAAFYNLTPLSVISSRLALAENGILPLFLGSLISSFYFLTTKKEKYWIFACLLGAIAMLMKLSGVSIIMFLLLIAFNQKMPYRQKLFPILFGGLAILAFVIYGAYYNWQVFIKVFNANSARFYGMGAEAINHLFLKPALMRPFTDGWIIAAFITSLAVIYKDYKKSKSVTFLSLALFSLLVVFLFFGSEAYGWYRFLFYPVVYIFLSRYLIEAYEKQNLILYFVILMLPFGTTLHRLFGVENFQQYVTIYRLLIFSVVVLLALSFYDKAKLITRILMLGFLFYLFWLSAGLIYFYSPETWLFVT